jgi:hypothetical protein
MATVAIGLSAKNFPNVAHQLFTHLCECHLIAQSSQGKYRLFFAKNYLNVKIT